MNLDEILFRAVNGLAGRASGVDALMLAVADPTLLWAPGILLGGYWLWLNWREVMIAAPGLAGTIGASDFVGARIKDLIARPRPCMVLSQLHQLEACGKVFSFPSNHALNTATAAAFFQILYPRSGWVSWPIVALIGFARVYIGAHYVTDIIGGWLIGGLFGVGAAWLLLCWSRFRTAKAAATFPQLSSTEK